MPPVLPSQLPNLPKAEAVSEGPPPSYLEQIGAAFRITKDEVPIVQGYRLEDEYQPIFDALYDLNGKKPGDYISRFDQAIEMVNPFGGDMDKYDVDAIWRDVKAAQAKGHLKGLPTDREAFEKAVLTRRGARGKDQAIMARGDSYTAPFIGGMGAMALDPVNQLTMPLGFGGKTIVQAAIRGAALNMGLEAVQQVPLASTRERMGEELTLKEAAINIGAAGFFGGLLEGGAKAFGTYVAPVLTKKLEDMTPLEKQLAKALEAENITTGSAIDDAIFGKVVGRLDDEGLADLAEVMVGLDNLSPDERGAIAMLRRQAQIDAMNPYIADGAGLTAHRDGLASALQSIMDAAPASPTRAPGAPRPEVVANAPIPRLRGDSAAVAPLTGNAFATVKSKIAVVESGGSNTAKNPKSSATGKYQFIDSTWIKYYVRRYGRSGMTDTQILNLRSNGAVQDALMDDLMADNAAALRNAGHAVDAGNLYLAHFAGTGGANKLLRADPNASARSVLGDAVIKANPFLAKMSAGDVINWAHRKMTGKGAVSRGNGNVSQAIDVDPESGVRDWIDQELAAVDAERARLDAEEQLRDDALPDAVTIADSLPDIEPVRPIEPVARLPEPPAIDVMAILPELRKVVQSRKIRLDRQKDIAETLGVDVETVRKGLAALAENKEIRSRVDAKGQERYTQIPRDNRPEDILRFIARRGGLSADGLDPRFRDKVGTHGHALGKGGRDWDKHFVHGAGRLVRKNGKGLDDMGELLWDAGYFGPPETTPRPTESELIDAIEDAVTGRRKIFATGDAPEDRSLAKRAPWLDEQDMLDMRRDFDAVAEAQGIALDDEAFDMAARMFADGEHETVADAIIAMINSEIEAYQAARYYELGEVFDDAQVEEFLASAREAGFDVDGGFDRSTVDATDAGAGGATGRDGDRQAADQRPQQLEPEAYKPFDDPAEGAGAATQIDSMEHDLRAMHGRFGNLIVGDGDYAGARLLIYQPTDKTKSDANMLMWLGSDGTAEISIDGLDAVGLQGPTGANRFGPSEVRDVMRQIVKLFPEIRAFSGERLTGAGIGREQRVDLPTTRETPPSSRETSADDMFGGPTQAEKRAALERRGESGLSTDATQKPVGSDGGLFDPDSWAQAGFRLDEEGDVVNPADLLAQFDAEEAILKNIKDCL